MTLKIISKINDSEVMNALNWMERRFTGSEMVSDLLREASFRWIPHIIGRLNISAAQYDYSREFSSTMFQLDEEFALQMDNTRFIEMNEFERRGANVRSGATSEIQTIVTQPSWFKMPGRIAVGIGDIDRLNQATALEDNYFLWELLEYGTGVHSSGIGSVSAGFPITRSGGTQVFYDRRPGHEEGVMARMTVSEGMKGRHYFLEVNGMFYSQDLLSAEKLLGSMVKIVNYANKTRFKTA